MNNGETSRQLREMEVERPINGGNPDTKVFYNGEERVIGRTESVLIPGSESKVDYAALPESQLAYSGYQAEKSAIEKDKILLDDPNNKYESRGIYSSNQV